MKTLSKRAPELSAALVIAAQAAAALYMAVAGPTHPIPMHFNGSGVVDHWGDRREAAGFLLLMAGVSLLVVLSVGPLSRRRGVEPSARTVRTAQVITLTVTSAVCALVFALSYGRTPESHGGALGLGLLSGIFALIGAFLGKIGPNTVVGVRTPWNFASRLAWDKSNRLAGRLFFWGGLVGLAATPIAPQPLGLHLMIGFVVVSAAAVVFESWRVWRSDPERTPAF